MLIINKLPRSKESISSVVVLLPVQRCISFSGREGW